MTDADYFVEQLKHNKSLIDAEVDRYWQHKLKSIRETYGETSAHAIEAYAGIMARGGKRIRAALAEASYRMFGGKDERVIKGMGLTLEMIHAYVLIIDDICDHSDLRRGGPTAHKMLEKWHREAALRGDEVHFGASMATLAAMTGSHEAMLELSKLPVDATRRIAAIENLNQFIAVTCHGQFNDIMNEVSGTRDAQRIEDVLIWKTAYYTFANPLQLGAILAGASQPMLALLMDYSLAAGRAFQISDDILGLFGDADDTGKSPADDIKEGKRTILTIKALEMANPKDATFLEAQLGNPNLSAEAFERCKDIINDSGALHAAQVELERSCQKAIDRASGSGLPGGDGVKFLSGLASYLKDRKA